jgi:hypothetical protein
MFLTGIPRIVVDSAHLLPIIVPHNPLDNDFVGHDPVTSLLPCGDGANGGASDPQPGIWTRVSNQHRAGDDGRSAAIALSKRGPECRSAVALSGERAQRISPSRLAARSAPALIYQKRDSGGDMQEADCAPLIGPTWADRIVAERLGSRYSVRQIVGRPCHLGNVG